MEGRQQGCEAEGRGSEHDNMVLLSGFTGNSPWDFPGGSDGKASVYSVRDLGVIPGLGRFPGEEMATHSSILALRILWTEELGAGYCSWGRKESGTTERLHFHFPT